MKNTTSSISEVCFEKGVEYAKTIGHLFSGLKHGFYRVLELGEESDEIKRRKEEKIQEIQEKIKNCDDEIEKAANNANNLSKEIDEYKDEINTLESEQGKEEEIKKQYEDKVKKGGTEPIDKFLYRIKTVLLFCFTIAVVVVYTFLWYRVLFASIDEPFKAPFDFSIFLDVSFHNISGLIVSIFLTAIVIALLCPEVRVKHVFTHRLHITATKVSLK